MPVIGIAHCIRDSHSHWHAVADATTSTGCPEVDRMPTFFRPVLRLLSVLEEESGRLSSESSLPSIKALPLTVMGPLPCS